MVDDTSQTTPLNERIAMTALNSMLAKGWLDICTIDKVATIMGVAPKCSKSYSLLSALHCVHYSEMPAEVRDALPGLIRECLGIAPIYQFRTLAKGIIVIGVESEENKSLTLSGKVLKILGR